LGGELGLETQVSVRTEDRIPKTVTAKKNGLTVSGFMGAGLPVIGLNADGK
jgi:hypothetical protein